MRRGRGNSNQNILYEKKTIFNERKKFHVIHVIYHLLNIKAIFHTEKMFLWNETYVYVYSTNDLYRTYMDPFPS